MWCYLSHSDGRVNICKRDKACNGERRKNTNGRGASTGTRVIALARVVLVVTLSCAALARVVLVVALSCAALTRVVLVVTLSCAALIRVSLAVTIGSTAICLLYTSPSPRDLSTSRMPSSA